jgi:hypothetical protein
VTILVEMKPVAASDSGKAYEDSFFKKILDILPESVRELEPPAPGPSQSPAQ